MKLSPVFLIPLMLLGLLVWSNPFSIQAKTQKFDLQSLTAAQRQNLTVALKPIHGVVLAPGETFSFNHTVGPRTALRGYVAAPSYLGGDSPATLGGGICLLSSVLYQLALNNGLRVVERHPHLRPIHSVPAGLDATVWYGQADLQFKNTTNQPVQLHTVLQDNTLVIGLASKTAIPQQTLRRETTALGNLGNAANGLQVTVYQNNQLLTRDLYRIPFEKLAFQKR